MIDLKCQIKIFSDRKTGFKEIRSFCTCLDSILAEKKKLRRGPAQRLSLKILNSDA